MSPVTRITVNAILFVACFSICVRTRSQVRPTKTAGASVSGHVSVHDKSIAGVIITMRPERTGGPMLPGRLYKATTDQEGNYRISGVPAGKYQIAPSAPTYSRYEYKAVFLNDGDDVQNIDFSMVQGGVVTGRVTDSDGRPLIQEGVYLIEQKQTNSSPIYSGDGVQTDDRGIYRMFGVSPGSYKVAVGRSDQNPLEAMRGARPFKQAFYPSVSDAAKATVIEVGEGTEATNIDISVGRPEQTFTASGRVIEGENNQPVPNVGIGVTAFVDGNARGTSFFGQNQTNLKGEFTVENLLPGKYAVVAVGRQDSPVYAEPVIFEIADQDVTGLIIKKQRGAEVSGTIAIDGSMSKEIAAMIPRLRLQVYVRNSEGIGSGFGQFTRINPDLSFHIGGLQPGSVFFSVSFMDRMAMKGLTVQRIEREGVVQPNGVDIKQGEQVGGVKIFLSYGSASIRGVVNFVNGPLPESGRVMVRVSKQDGPKEFGTQAEVDARGRFIAEGLTAGVYEITVGAYWPGMTRQPSARQQVTLSEGVSTDVTLVVDLKPDTDTKP